MNHPLSVGIVGPLPPPSGGMANQTQQLANLLKQESINVEVVQTNAPYKPACVEKIPVIRALFRLFFYTFRLWGAAGRVDVFHIMANSGWSWHLFTMPAVWIAKLRGTATIVNYRGGKAEKFFSQSFKTIKPTLNACSKIVVPSRFLEEVFTKRNIKTQIIANIIDLERFTPEQSKAVTQSPHLLVARNLEQIYNNAMAIHTLHEIKKTFPQATLTIAGSGPDLENLKQLVNHLKLADSVNFTGRVDTLQMPALYQSADVMLNTSRVDNMPNSILESLASGVPVVSTDVGGIPFMVEHGKNVLLVKSEDFTAMANSVLQILENKKLRESLITEGRVLVRNFSWPQVKVHWINAYKELSHQ